MQTPAIFISYREWIDQLALSLHALYHGRRRRASRGASLQQSARSALGHPEVSTIVIERIPMLTQLPATGHNATGSFPSTTMVYG